MLQTMAASKLFYLLGALYSASLSGGTLFPAPRSMEKKPIVCETEACGKRAQLLMESIDKSKDPCEDFYSYVCGKTTTEMEGEGAESTYMTKLEEKIQHKMIMMANSFPNITEAKNAMEMLALAYQVCMYNDVSLEDEIKQIKMFFSKQGWSGWPIIKGQQSGGKRFNTFEEYLLANRLDSVVQISPAPKPGRHGYMIKIAPMNTWMINHAMYGHIHESMNSMDTTDDAELSTGSRIPEMRMNEENDMQMNATDDANSLLGKAMIATAALFNKDASKEELKEVYTTMIMFAKEHEKLSQGGTMMKIEMKTIKEVESAIPGFPLLRSLNKFLEPVGVTMKEDYLILVENFELIDATIKFYMTKEPDDIFNSIGMTKIFDFLYTFSEAFRQMDAVKMYRKAIHETSPRMKFCFLFISYAQPDVIKKLYLETYFDPETKSAARRVLNAIGKAYYQRLAHISWMDHMTWKKASRQLWDMKPYVAYPKEGIDEEMIEKSYKNVTKFGRNDAFITVVEPFYERWFRKTFSVLRKDSAMSGYENPLDLMTYGYDPRDNSLEFSAGILQGMYFHRDLPKCVNLGAIGFLMAHEITNGLFFKGSEMMGPMMMGPSLMGPIDNGWTNYSLDAFNEKAKCFVTQYSGICEPLTMMKLGGQATNHKNIADSASVTIAFEALRSNLKDSPDTVLPGLEELTPEQLFFISYALPMCANVTSASLKMQIMTDMHVPNKYRVNIPLKNSLEFSAAFNCKRGSMMRLPDSERCDIW